MTLVLLAVLVGGAIVFAFFFGVSVGRDRLMREIQRTCGLVPKGDLEEFKRKTEWLNKEYDRRLGEIDVEIQARKLR